MTKTETIYTIYENPQWFTLSDKRSRNSCVWHEKWSNDIDFETLEEAQKYIAGKSNDGYDGLNKEVIYNEAPDRYKLVKVTTEFLEEKDSELKVNVDNSTKESLL